MSGGGSGSGYPSINVGGVTVEGLYVDPNTPYATRVRDISLCIAIQQMADTISDDTIRAALHSAAAQALDKEAHLFLTEVDAGVNAPAPKTAVPVG
jgi:hypothetical protein